MKKNVLISGILLFSLFHGFSQQTEERSPHQNTKQQAIMLLGVYHFNNPGKDTYNTEVDSYDSDKRQEEIKEVVDLLQAYKPTKILVEFSPEEQSKMDSLYDLYTSNNITLDDIEDGINEVYQIGFRLGKQLDGIEIIGIDQNGNWLAPYADFIADTLSLEYYQKNQIAEASRIKERNRLFLANSIRENLAYLNEWDQVLKNHSYYNNVAVKVKDTANIVFSHQEVEQEINGLPYQMRSFDFNNIGVEVVAEWYKRNLFIYRNILEKTEQNDRVLVIIGSGHVFYLHQLLSNNPTFNIVKPNDFLSGKE